VSAARGLRRRLFAIATVLGVVAAARAVRADEPADRGISLSVSAGGAYDGSVRAADTGRRVNDGAAFVGATGVGNLERVAIGGAVDVMPGAPGNGRLSLSALLGYQQQIGHTRFQLFGEAGRDRFSESGATLVGREPGPEVWLPFAGVRLAAARTVPAYGLFELGAALFARYDLDRATVTHLSDLMDQAPTRYRVGGFRAGLALQVGIRLESPHPWNQGVVEP